MSTRKVKRRQQKKVAARPPGRQARECPFYDFLEELGLICDGRFESELVCITAPDRSRRIGLAHFIDRRVQETRGTDDLLFWDVMEIIVPKDKLFLVCHSELYPDQEQASRRYHFWSVTWKQGRRLHAGTSLVTGECAPWRRYKCERMETGTYEPWVYLDINRGNTAVDLAWDVESLARYLHMSAAQQAKEAFPDKLTRKIVRFAWKADPDGFDDAVGQELSQYPDLRSSLLRLLPGKYSLPEHPPRKTWFTIRELARDLSVSQSTIRRVIHHLKLKPISRRRPWLYTRQQRREIRDTLNTIDARKQAK